MNQYGPRFVVPMLHALLDAGSDAADTLSGTLYRCIDEMDSGQVLEVISKDLDSPEFLSSWCGLAGHDLVLTEIAGDEVVFWIRKR